MEPASATEPAALRRDLTIPAIDGLELAATLHGDDGANRIALVCSATGVPRGFYGAFADALAARGYLVVTWDYRGIGGSRPARLRGVEARARDWVLLDMQGVVDWARARRPDSIVLVGHSIGGQLAGLLEDPTGIVGMLTLSAQSGHWRLQGGAQVLAVAFHVHVTMPGLTRVLGYMPWSLFGGEDLPRGVALEWARWCRDPRYLLGDDSLPLERFASFPAPVLAYSFADDDWGTARSVDAMMTAYPEVERRHVRPENAGLGAIGHFGFFRRTGRPLWDDAMDWLDAR